MLNGQKFKILIILYGVAFYVFTYLYDIFNVAIFKFNTFVINSYKII